MAGFIYLHTPKGIQRKAEIARGTIYNAITNIKVSKNFKKDCIYT
jgi:hypothetical protein